MEINYENTQECEDLDKKLVLLEDENDKLRYSIDDLENKLRRAESQIISMKLALSYSDSFAMRRDTEMREEIERLKKTITEKVEKKKRKESILTVEISKKSEYIDDLVTKIQTLYQKAEYYKEDLFKYQDEYSKTKELLEIEKVHKEMIRKNNEESNKNLAELQDSFRTLHEGIEEYKIQKELEIKEIKRKAAESFVINSENIRESKKKEFDKFTRVQTEKLENIIKSSNMLVQSQKSSSENRIESITRTYESRIASFIQEASYEEALHHSEVICLKNYISCLTKESEDMLKKNAYFMDKAHVKEEEAEHSNYLFKEITAQENEKVLESVLNFQRCMVEMENLKLNYEESKKTMIAEYEKMVRLNIQYKDEEIRKLNEHYEEQIEKLKRIIEEERDKKVTSYETQIEVLLGQIGEFEENKSKMEFDLLQRINSLTDEMENVR